jgi:phenylalanyl-tRNA synthetase alpha chain
MIDRIKVLIREVEELKAANADEIEALRIKYLSKKGEVSRLMNDFRDIASEHKREVGQYLNLLKEKAQQKINDMRDSFAGE